MKRIIVAAIFLASVNIESYYLRLFRYTILSSELQGTTSTTLSIQHPDILTDTYGDKDLEDCIAESLKPANWEITKKRLVYGKLLKVNLSDETNVFYYPLNGSARSIVHNPFFKFKIIDITQSTFKSKQNARIEINTYESTNFKSKYLVWDEKTHTNLKCFAAILGAGLAYAAYSKWFK
jgi:hypothetical protein